MSADSWRIIGVRDTRACEGCEFFFLAQNEKRRRKLTPKLLVTVALHGQIDSTEPRAITYW